MDIDLKHYDTHVMMLCLKWLSPFCVFMQYAVSSQDDAKEARMCYVCSGKFPDRDCELYPQYVTMGPGKIECARIFCSTIVRYKPKKHLMRRDPKEEIMRMYKTVYDNFSTRSRYQGQWQVITSHSIYGMQLLGSAINTCYWHTIPHGNVITK